MIAENIRIDSVGLLSAHDMGLLIMGLRTNGKNPYNGMLDLALHLLITIPYPIHLILGLFTIERLQDLFDSLIITVGLIVCSVKYFICRGNLAQMEKLKGILRYLDKQIEDEQEIEYYRKTIGRNTKIIVYGFGSVYLASVVTGFTTRLLSAERMMILNGWFPFDWQSSRVNYLCALMYQAVGVTICTFQNFCNDIYAPLTLSLLAGHIHLLSKRLKKIGFDTDHTEEQNLKALKAAIRDYHKIMEAYNIIKNIISWVLFSQFVIGGFDTAVTAIYMILYVDNIFEIIFLIVLIMAMLGQVFPACYTGTVLVYELEDLANAIFSCNWMDQSRVFRRNIILFLQMTMREFTIIAGGIFTVNVNTLFATMEMIYSIATFLIAMK